MTDQSTILNFARSKYTFFYIIYVKKQKIIDIIKIEKNWLKKIEDIKTGFQKKHSPTLEFLGETW